MMKDFDLKACSKIFYLGPQGSYSEMEKNAFVEKFGLNTEAIACFSIRNIIENLKNADNKALAVVPIENSVEGMVRESLDNLSQLAKFGIRIYSETNIKIEHCLIGYAKEKEEIKEVFSHPQALAQCREYLSENLGFSVKQIPAMSTSQGVSLLSKDEPLKAAIGSQYCANIYGIPVVELDINDEKNNTTRFVLLSSAKPRETKNSKLSITFSTLNESGALNRVLSVLEEYGLNMSQINSRPSKKELGEYVFYIDFEGHVDNKKVNLALGEISKRVKELEILSEGAILI